MRIRVQLKSQLLLGHSSPKVLVLHALNRLVVLVVLPIPRQLVTFAYGLVYKVVISSLPRRESTETKAVSSLQRTIYIGLTNGDGKTRYTVGLD